MLSDGTFVEARMLLFGSSLMAFHKVLDNRGYLRIKATGQTNEALEHQMIAQCKYGCYDPELHVHHIDGNTINNHPDNIELLTRSEHAQKHCENLLAHQKRITEERKGKTLEEWLGKEKAQEYKVKMVASAKKRSSWNKGLTGNKYKEHYKKGFRNQHTTDDGNHKVIKVEQLPDQFDVYDIQMPTTHNFVANEVFVHNCDHPDIVKFIKCKHVDKQISNFNISIAVTDEFMSYVQDHGHSIDYYWKTEFNGKKYLIQTEDDTPILVTEAKPDGTDKYYSVGDIWNLIVQQAWRNGEPGIIFIDEIKRKNGESINATNPCGEQPLNDYEACCLGSIDLSKFVIGDKGPWDLDSLRTTIFTAVDILNAMIDSSYYPLEEIDRKVRETRKIGLGIMGWADALIKMQLRYGSERSLEVAEAIMSFIQKEASTASEEKGYHNTTFTTIAPTGSISILAGCSSGIEPNYDWITKHHREDFEDQIVTHPLAIPYLNDKEFKLTGAPDYFVTTEDISPEEHINMQAAFQIYVDNAVSKTINLPNGATEEDVGEALMYAWKRKCKGVTIYRDGSRQNQVISKVISQDSSNTLCEVSQDTLSWEEFAEQMGLPNERPYCLDGFTFKLAIDMGDGKVENAYLTVNLYEGSLYEIFLNGNIREAAPIIAQYIDTTTRLISLSLRGGTPLEKVIEQLEKVPCSHLFSIPHKIAHALREFLPDDAHEPCPDCGEKVIFSEGCEKCSACSWGRCG
jgi:ribonucleoside-diphosphate reductase alpha chain